MDWWFGHGIYYIIYLWGFLLPPPPEWTTEYQFAVTVVCFLGYMRLYSQHPQLHVSSPRLGSAGPPVGLGPPPTLQPITLWCLRGSWLFQHLIAFCLPSRNARIWKAITALRQAAMCNNLCVCGGEYTDLVANERSAVVLVNVNPLSHSCFPSSSSPSSPSSPPPSASGRSIRFLWPWVKGWSFGIRKLSPSF